MDKFPIFEIDKRSNEIAKAIDEGPVMIVDHDGNPLGVLLHPDEYAVLEAVAEIANDPVKYAKAIEIIGDDEPTRAVK